MKTGVSAPSYSGGFADWLGVSLLDSRWIIAIQTVNPFVDDWRERHIRWGRGPKSRCPQQQVRLEVSLVLN